MKRVAFQTLGCKLNQFESDSLATQFVDAGYTLVGAHEEAEAYIINTCTVTGKADRKSRNLMYQARRRSGEHKGRSLVVVTGCFVEGRAEEIGAYENTYVVGNKRKHAILQIVEAHRRGEILDQRGIVEDRFAFRPARPHYHTRGTLKIQDGCDNFCTFCIIPFVRGGATSRPHERVLEDMREYARMGYREVTLTGVNISRYRSEGVGFSLLLERLLETAGDFRVRISSLEPDGLDERFFALLEHPKMTPHLHLCLQSGSERILLRMRRQYTAAQYQGIVDRIRGRNPYFNITTDIIIGFPGESEGDFRDSCEMVRRNGMGHVHIFPYARRSGTRAARMEGECAAQSVKARCRALKEVADAGKARYRRSLLGVGHVMLAERVVGDEGASVGKNKTGAGGKTSARSETGAGGKTSARSEMGAGYGAGARSETGVCVGGGLESSSPIGAFDVWGYSQYYVPMRAQYHAMGESDNAPGTQHYAPGESGSHAQHHAMGKPDNRAQHRVDDARLASALNTFYSARADAIEDEDGDEPVLRATIAL